MHTLLFAISGISGVGISGIHLIAHCSTASAGRFSCQFIASCIKAHNAKAACFRNRAVHLPARTENSLEVSAAMEASTSQARWELENNIQTTDAADAIYTYSAAEQQAIQAQRPWTRDPHYFKRWRRRLQTDQ